LAGFAEISGSGIRALQRACQIANRPVPVIKSDPQANTFTLIIDWSERGNQKDAYWRTLLGISIGPVQAEVLNVIVQNPSVTISGIETQTGLDVESIASALDFLELQVLVTSEDSNYRLSDHLREQLG
jgi:predicted HTH transcriptional regulator